MTVMWISVVLVLAAGLGVAARTKTTWWPVLVDRADWLYSARGIAFTDLVDGPRR